MREWTWELWLAIVLLALILGAAVIAYRDTIPDAGQTQVFEDAVRLDMMAGVWDESPQRTVAGCPTVRALEAALPELAPIRAVERDYVAWSRFRQDC